MKHHVDWLRQRGMVVNTSKTELVRFKSKEGLYVDIGSEKIQAIDSMNVLGVTFDGALTWEPQLRRVIASCNRMKPALRSLSKRLSMKELLQVVTSHYYPRLYYASEVWFHPLKKILKDKLNPVHNYPLRLALKDFKKVYSNRKVAVLTRRAMPFEINNFKVARLIISVINSTNPFCLFHDLVSHAVIERRCPLQPSFFDTSRSRIGRQSIANRISTIFKNVNFDWNGVDLSKDQLRRLLKTTFFHSH
jgi:hypothetical protein